MSLDLSKFTEGELIALNQEIVERLKYIRKFNALKKIVEFKLGDLVSFTPPGKKKLIGIIVRLNTQSISVITLDEVKWTVPVQAIKKIKPSKTSALKAITAIQKKLKFFEKGS